MKRRAEPPRDEPPPSLRTFDPADWDDDTVPPAGRQRASYTAWSSARKAWASRYGWPGDRLEELLERVAEHRRAHG